MTTWRVKINDGPEQDFTTLTGSYQDAALAAFAMLPYEHKDGMPTVEIWVPDLLPDYPPFLFGMGYDVAGHRKVAHLVRRQPNT